MCHGFRSPLRPATSPQSLFTDANHGRVRGQDVTRYAACAAANNLRPLVTDRTLPVEPVRMACSVRAMSGPGYVYALCPSCLLQLHRQIREAGHKLQRRRLRLNHAGRFLNDGTQLSSWLGTLEEERQQRAHRCPNMVINDRMNFGGTVYMYTRVVTSAIGSSLVSPFIESSGLHWVRFLIVLVLRAQ